MRKNKQRAGHRGRGSRTHADPASESVKTLSTDIEEDATVTVHDAFHKSFPDIKCLQERGRLFVVGAKSFAVVERSLGPTDDIVYSQNREVWEHVPRGNARVFVKDPTADPEAFAPVGGVNGLRKFGYGDSDYGYPSDVTQVIAMRNDFLECGHLAAFVTPDDNKPYWIIGSKNVHIVCQYEMPESDLCTYKGMRYVDALKMANLWREMLREREKAGGSYTDFHSALTEHRWTACFEAIFTDRQHPVDYHGLDEMRFYAITTDGVPSDDELCVDVRQAATFYKQMGVFFSPYSDAVHYPSPAYDALIDDIYRRYDSEGTLMCGYNAAGKIIRLWKESSYPSVMERAAREAIVNYKLTDKSLLHLMQGKLKLQKTELRKYFTQWEDERLLWLVAFASWSQETQVILTSPAQNPAFRKRWLSLQDTFREATAKDSELFSKHAAYEQDPVAWGNPRSLDIIKLVGPPGCGKSTLSRAIFVLLTEAGFQPQWVNQDVAGNRDKYLAAIRQATQPDTKVTHIIVDQVNNGEKVYIYYRGVDPAVTATWWHEDGEAGMLQECYNRVIRRGSAHHTIRLPDTLTPPQRQKEMAKIRTSMAHAVRSFKMPQDNSVAVLDMGLSPANSLEPIWALLQVNGIHELPDLDKLDVQAAILLSDRYEALLTSQPRVPIYAAIVMDDPEAVLRCVSASVLNSGQVVQSQFHITTKFFGGDLDLILFVKLAELLGTSIEVTAEAVYTDSKGTAIKIRNDDEFICANPIAHITVANRKGVPPKYSNELISSAYKNQPGCRRSVIPVPPEVAKLRGTFQFR